MAFVLVAILLIGYVLIATGYVTNVNRAAIAMLSALWDGFCIYAMELTL